MPDSISYQQTVSIISEQGTTQSHYNKDLSPNTEVTRKDKV